MTGNCAICGTANATIGLRVHGFLTQIPEARRRYLWVCPGPCEAEAWPRKAQADAATPVVWPEVEGVSLAQLDMFGG